METPPFAPHADLMINKVLDSSDAAQAGRAGGRPPPPRLPPSSRVARARSLAGGRRAHAVLCRRPDTHAPQSGIRAFAGGHSPRRGG